MSRILRYDDYTIAWISVLPIEAEAALGVLDKRHEGHFESVRGDDYTYLGGEINGHNVVIAKLPLGQNYGEGAAAALVNQVKARFPNIWFALLVGVAAGLPNLATSCATMKRDIRLGDVLVCVPSQGSTGIIHYDLGKDTEQGFLLNGRLAETPALVRSAIGEIQLLEKRPFRKGSEMNAHLHRLLITLDDDKFRYPGQDQDELFQHEEIENTATSTLTPRQPRDDQELTQVWYGNIGSGNTLMRNALRRNELRDKHDLIGLEMEAAGVMNTLPTAVIRGVCDYGDVHKTKQWQPYAAAVAAVYAKAILLVITPKTVSTSQDKILSTFPFPRNDDIIEREDLFRKLEQSLPAKTDFQTTALWGLGGSGKTQIALEFAYRRHINDQFPVFWVHADNYNKFLQGYYRIAAIANLPSELKGSEMLTAVRQWLEGNSKWLLVMDNADDLRWFASGKGTVERGSPESLRQFIPCGSSGSILWTTRDNRIIGDLVGLNQGINVTNMAHEEAKQLLTSISGCSISLSEEDIVRELLESIDRLPLAIAQAASYIRETDRSFAAYLTKYQRQSKRWRLLEVEGSRRFRQEDVSNGVMQTWQITIEHLQKEYPNAYWILQVAAWFHNQRIPQSLLVATGRLLKDQVEGQTGKRLQHRDESRNSYLSDSSDEEDDDNTRMALTRLEQFSFLKSRLTIGNARMYNTHKLVQEATRYAILRHGPKGELPKTAGIALDVLLQVYPSGEYGTWDQCGELLAHVTTVCSWPSIQIRKVDICDLLSRASLYLFYQGNFKEAEEIGLKVLDFRKATLGETHPDTIGSMSHLAATLHRQGRLDEAEKLKLSVLEVRQQALGDEHEDTIWCMASLATTCYQQRRLREAEDIQRKILEFRKRVKGPQHPDTIWSMAELAATYYRQERLDEAEKIQIDALALRKEVLGITHPDSIKSMADLATTVFKQGRLSTAEEMQNDIVSFRKKILGENHPDTTQAMLALASTLYQQDKTNKAEEVYRDVLKHQQLVLGSTHPEVLKTKQLLTRCHEEDRHLTQRAELRQQQLQSEDV